MLIHDIDPLLRSKGTIVAVVDGRQVTFDLANIHERRYAACAVAKLQYPQYDIDAMLLHRFVRKGDRVLDAGANIGLTALECLRAGALSVYCIEPVPALADRINALQEPRITVEAAALSDNIGKTMLTLSQTHNQGSTCKNEKVNFAPALFGEHPETIEVAATSVDAIVRKRGSFDVWKFDIEFAEVDAIRGAKETLRRAPPRVIIAELYDPTLAAFCDLVGPSHDRAYRALIARDGYHLTLLDRSQWNADLGGFHLTSPMYVFVRSR